ncbi:hypothetical protein A5650_23610 [Mycobacterium sp. 1164985.4]|nr:hypothetical protein A5698_22805 [Mycobacterium sp. E136]OBK82184.1 hypothetical protein A5650_23610 [Mycobacterium sp. 1164985.4]
MLGDCTADAQAVLLAIAMSLFRELGYRSVMSIRMPMWSRSFGWWLLWIEKRLCGRVKAHGGGVREAVEIPRKLA